jgi:hypothetical protein
MQDKRQINGFDLGGRGCIVAILRIRLDLVFLPFII